MYAKHTAHIPSFLCAPVWFHTRMSSPLSKSSSSEDNSLSTSVSPGPSNASGFISPEVAPALFIGMGCLYGGGDGTDDGLLVSLPGGSISASHNRTANS